MNGGETIIKVKDLTAGYEDRVVLKDIHFQVRAGEIIAIVGPSGSGKSTLLKHLVGLNPPLGGEIWIEGKNLVNTKGAARQELLRTFGVLFQSGALFGSMTVFDNVKLPLDEFTDLPEVAKDLVVSAKLRLVGLASVGEAKPAELSGGMEKRAALARAMALDPRILFLDEPAVGLDPITAAGLDELVLRLSRRLGITQVIVTHQLTTILSVASRVLMLDDQSQTIIAEGNPVELRDHSQDPRVRAFFRREAGPSGTLRQTERV